MVTSFVTGPAYKQFLLAEDLRKGNQARLGLLRRANTDWTLYLSIQSSSANSRRLVCLLCEARMFPITGLKVRTLHLKSLEFEKVPQVLTIDELHQLYVYLYNLSSCIRHSNMAQICAVDTVGDVSLLGMIDKSFD